MINREINASVVRVVGLEGAEGLTEMSLDDAIALAEETDEDVILLNDATEIPVVKIGDYKKMLYERQKKEKENKKKQRLNAQNVKDIQISDSIAEHDLAIKAKSIDRILNDGDKVNLTIIYKGRSIRMIEHGAEKLNYLESLVTVGHKIDKPAKIEGNKVSMTISPSKK